MIKHHPTQLELQNYVAGQLSPAMALMVSAHVDMCHRCKAVTNQMLEEQVLSFDDSEPLSFDEHTFSKMFNDIVTQSSRDKAVCSKSSSDSRRMKTLTLEGRTFDLPSSLQRLAFSVGPWSKYVGKLWQANVTLGGRNLAQFIYMEKGGGVPEHTHGGNETTLVIDGTFEDENGVYNSGDFIGLNDQHTHTPVTISNDGCLVFSVIDEPLSFTTGWARLINPLSQLYFQVSTKNQTAER